jgi:hypothetical protein
VTRVPTQGAIAQCVTTALDSETRGTAAKARATSTSKYRRTFTEVWSYDADFDVVPDQAHARGLVAVDAAKPWTQFAIAQMGVGLGALESRVSRTERLVSWHIVLEQKRWCEMQLAMVATRVRVCGEYEGRPSRICATATA